jgi:Calcineurin-like phosphoesterase
MSETPSKIRSPEAIPALLPRESGHQFVLYGDACSGIPGAQHEKTFAAVNAVVRRLTPEPEFIIFTGDEIVGLTPDPERLRSQWRHWLENEMAWLDRHAIPIWHSTGNHTAYDKMSEQVFREMLDLPDNGPADQAGLSYWVRRGNLLIVFVHTLWTGLGGEGFVETKWLGDILRKHGEASYRLVVGHHPVFSVNGFSGWYQREIGPETARAFWDTLVSHGVTAYLCSHILAFDVQVHRGVLQICTAGAGTAHRMPEGIEYHHCVQMCLDASGLRYQVLDTDGRVRERLSWPATMRTCQDQMTLPHGTFQAPIRFPADHPCIVLRFRGRTASGGQKASQTLLSINRPDELAPLWIGLRGAEQRLTAIVHYEAGRSPHYWLGPSIEPGNQFDIEVMLHSEMGPGGIMYRVAGDRAWTSMSASSPWGLECLRASNQWSIGHLSGGDADRPFTGTELAVLLAW